MKIELFEVLEKLSKNISLLAEFLRTNIEEENLKSEENNPNSNDYSYYNKKSTKSSHFKWLKFDGKDYKLKGRIISSTEKSLQIQPANYHIKYWIPRRRKSDNTPFISNFVEEKFLMQWFTIDKWILGYKGII